MKTLFSSLSIAAPVALALVAVLFIKNRLDAAPGSTEPAQRAPSWVLKDLDGREVRSDQFAGKTLVVDFWATWCGPCRIEIPGYIALQKKYADKDLVIIGVSLDRQGPAGVKRFVAEQGINYPVVMADAGMVEDFGGVDAIPTTFIIDREGFIRQRKVGAMHTEQFEELLKPVLTAK